jgi:hypothetical protein
MSEPEETDEGSYLLQTPFWVDTDGYTDRDRLMFTCGVEFEMVFRQLKTGDAIDRPIHRENESRCRMLCGRFKRKCTITPWVDPIDPAGTWSFLVVEPGLR